MSIGSEVKNALKETLPILGAAATGNIPAAVQMAATAIGNVLNKKVDANADAIALAVAGATPEQQIALRKLDYDYQMGLLQLDANDRDSARKREETVKDNTPKIIAYGTLALSFLFEGLYLHYGAGKASPELVGRILGGFDAARMLVLAYYFGSSNGQDLLNRKSQPVEKK